MSIRNALRSMLFAGGLLMTNTHAAYLPKDIRITNAEMREFSGEPSGLQNGHFTLITREGIGEATFFFTLEDIHEIDFLDTDTLEEAQSLKQKQDWPNLIRELEPLWRKRAPYLAFLEDPGFASPGLDLLEAYLHSQRFMEAATLGESLRSTYPDSLPIQTLATEALMQAYLELDIPERALPLANTWLKEHPVGTPDALGSWVLAEIAYRNEAYEKTRWLALRPISFASRLPTRKLAECYILAAVSSWQLGQAEEAIWWISEGERRCPDAIQGGPHTDTLLLIRDWWAEQQTGETDASTEDPIIPPTQKAPPATGGPEKDLSLELESVIKLSSNPESTAP